MSLSFEKMLFHGHLDDDEELITVVHKHWIEIIGPFLKFVSLGVIFPWVMWALLNLSITLPLLWSVGFYLWFLYNSLNWYCDAFLITTLSVIDIEWISLFHRTSSRVSYHDLKELAYEINGIIATILNYGRIDIHLNSGETLTLERVKNPQNIEFLIKDLQEKFLHDQKMTDTSTLQEILAEIVKNHITEHGLPSAEKKLHRKTF